jgi:hypothetical protein
MGACWAVRESCKFVYTKGMLRAKQKVCVCAFFVCVCVCVCAQTHSLSKNCGCLTNQCGHVRPCVSNNETFVLQPCDLMPILMICIHVKAQAPLCMSSEYISLSTYPDCPHSHAQCFLGPQRHRQHHKQPPAIAVYLFESTKLEGHGAWRTCRQGPTHVWNATRHRSRVLVAMQLACHGSQHVGVHSEI